MPLGSFRLNSIAKMLAAAAPPAVAEPWSLAAATYDVKKLDVAGAETTPNAVYFRPDGTRFYVVGPIVDTVRRFTMSTPWDVSSASTTPDASDLKSVTTQETSPTGLFFRPDGFKMFITGSGSDRVHEYELGTAWSLPTATATGVSLLVSGQDSNPSGLFFRPDGLGFYIVGNTNDTVHQYSLSSPWNMGTANYTSTSFSVAAQETAPTGVHFKPDGTKMFIVGSISDNVHEYTLGTAWAVNTATYVRSFSVSSQDGSSSDLFIRPNGTKMYILGTEFDEIHQYSLAADIPTVTVSPASVNEDNGVTSFTITATDFTAYNGTTVYLRHYVNSILQTTTTQDLNSFEASKTVASGGFTSTATARQDSLTEGNELYFCEVYADSGFTTLLATSNTATIVDTSLTPAVPTSISVHTNVTSLATTITMPSTIIAGDVAVLFDFSTTTTSVTPSTWTLINGASTTGIRTNISSKLLTGTEGGSTITGMAGTTRKVLVIYRGNTAINSITTTVTGTQATTATPSNQSLVGQSGPMAAIAVYAKTLSTTPTRGWSVGSPTEYSSISTSGIYVKSLITNSGTPATTTISMTDAGTNTLQSFRIKFS